jgi:hypothetical protein
MGYNELGGFIMWRHQFSLFARPSFLEGVARLVDFTGLLNTYNTSDSPQEADYRAMLADWEAVGIDVRESLRQFEREYQEEISRV